MHLTGGYPGGQAEYLRIPFADSTHIRVPDSMTDEQAIGLGIAEMLAARRLTKLLELEGMEPVVRAFGAREIASGMTTLSTEKEAGLWSRLAGVALDFAVLARGMTPLQSPKTQREVGIANSRRGHCAGPTDCVGRDSEEAPRINSRHLCRP